MDDERPVQRPEGALIETAQKRSPFSQRQAAARAGISEGHWRNIVKGYQTVSAGVTAPIKGAAETVARMAQAVDVTAEQLAEANREDAAQELRALPPIEDTESEPTVAELADRLTRMEATIARQQQEHEALLQRLRDITGMDSGGTGEEPGQESDRRAI